MHARLAPEERRLQVIEAAFRRVVAEGTEGLSLRKVADEADMNIGSVRHYFDGHTDLLAAAADEAGRRMGCRLADHEVEDFRGLTGTAALDALQSLVETVLPIDEARRDEAIVVVELIMASRTMPAFRATSKRMAEDLSSVLRSALDALDVPEAELGAAQIAAMIGGLTIDSVTPHGNLSAGRLRTILRTHLQMLLSSAGRG